MKKISYAVLMAILFVGFTGCGDDSSSTGPDVEENPPQIPDLTEVAQPDVSYFEENNPQGQKEKESQILDDHYSNYTNARFKAIFGTFFTSFGQLYMGFLNPAYDESPDFNDGQWVWTYDHSVEGESISMQFTAEDVGSSVSWAMFVAYDDGQGGGYNYKVMEGTTSDDGSQGSWTFNAYEEDGTTEKPAAKTEWDVTSETERTINTDLYNDDGSVDTAFDYEQNGAEHTMVFTDAGNSDTDTVFWDTDTKTGYVIEDGEKMCWDDAFQNIACE
ncbi:hypothetical protein [Fodinibius sp.]|uniref:hypothetical protein n=1 Tax=Fodinibius sp. TaxID=1872440 RepID=UPI003563B74E